MNIDTIDPEVLDPATPANRVLVARRMLADAIRHYDEASEQWADAQAHFPKLPRAKPPLNDEEVEERRSWQTVLELVDEGFNAAELVLAERIEALFDMVAPPGRSTREEPGEYFVPRAVRSRGNVYVLAYSSTEFEAKTNIIAVYRNNLAIDLAEVE